MPEVCRSEMADLNRQLIRWLGALQLYSCYPFQSLVSISRIPQRDRKRAARLARLLRRSTGLSNNQQKGKGMLRTRLCKLLDIEVPIIAAPSGPNITCTESVAAVSDAGGRGIISFGANPPSILREQINQWRELTRRRRATFPPAAAVINSGSSPAKGAEP